MKLHRFFRYMPRKKFENWVFTNFFSEDKPISVSIYQMYQQFGFRCRYDFDPKAGFVFTFRKFPKEKRYFLDVEDKFYKPIINEDLSYLDNISIDDEKFESEIRNRNRVEPLKIRSIQSMIIQNPEKYLSGQLKFLVNTSGKTRIVATKYWWIIPIQFRTLESRPEPYIDRAEFLRVFQNALTLLIEYPDLINKDHKPIIIDGNINDFVEDENF